MTIWPVFLIALYWTSQHEVEAKRLPDEHMKEAIECLKEFVGEDFVHASFKNVLSYGEYLGDLCKNADIDVIEEKVKKDNKGQGLEVQECLAKKNLADVYTKIREYGLKRLIEMEKLKEVKEEDMRAEQSQQAHASTSEVKLTLEEDVSEDNDEDVPAGSTTAKTGDKVAASKIPQTSPSGDIQTKDDKLKAASQAAPKQPFPLSDISNINESQKIPGEDSDEINPDKFSDLGKYVIGMCLKDDTVDFLELEDDQDKKTAIGCLENCTTRFLIKIKNSLFKAKEQIVNIMEENRKKLLDDNKIAPNLTPQQYQEIINKFKTQTTITEPVLLLSKDKSQDIDTLTTAGQAFMTQYSQIYVIVDKYLGESDIDPDEDLDAEVIGQLKAIPSKIEGEESLDSKLRHSFVIYKSCAKVQCYMKVPKSVPLYTLIHSKAKEPEFDIQSAFIPKKKQAVSQERKFYVALTHQLDEVGDDDDDSSSSEEQEAV